MKRSSGCGNDFRQSGDLLIRKLAFPGPIQEGNPLREESNCSTRDRPSWGKVLDKGDEQQAGPAPNSAPLRTLWHWSWLPTTCLEQSLSLQVSCVLQHLRWKRFEPETAAMEYPAEHQLEIEFITDFGGMLTSSPRVVCFLDGSSKTSHNQSSPPAITGTLAMWQTAHCNRKSGPTSTTSGSRLTRVRCGTFRTGTGWSRTLQQCPRPEKFTTGLSRDA